MEPSPPEPALAPWQGPQETLGGSLSARPRGIAAPEFVLLDRDGGEFGRMVMHGPEGARLDAGSLRARIERVASPARYRMLTGEAETLVAYPAGSSVAMKIRCAGRPYEAAFYLLRNTAAAAPVGDGETARLTGGVLTRRYQVLFDTGDGRSLPIALFLLYYTVTLRRRAFLTGSTVARR
ncbi:MAG TPA: hypothetical protein VK869_07775 [Rubrobacteraceae bacterium]|nr:hypothetical protein [Rubrobacteraceae bacterium]